MFEKSSTEDCNIMEHNKTIQGAPFRPEASERSVGRKKLLFPICDKRTLEKPISVIRSSSIHSISTQLLSLFLLLLLLLLFLFLFAPWWRWRWWWWFWTAIKLSLGIVRDYLTLKLGDYFPTAIVWWRNWLISPRLLTILSLSLSLSLSVLFVYEWHYTAVEQRIGDSHNWIVLWGNFDELN